MVEIQPPIHYLHRLSISVVDELEPIPAEISHLSQRDKITIHTDNHA